MIRVVIVDDEEPARGENAAAGFTLAGDPEVDVVFLDIEMPGVTGLAAAPLMRERADPPAVVFVTAHAEYAVDAFAVEAFDYLLKPVDPERLARVLERLRDRSREHALPVEKIPVVAAGGSELLDVGQVHYLQADGDYRRVHTYDRSYLSTASLGELEERLGAGFARGQR